MIVGSLHFIDFKRYLVLLTILKNDMKIYLLLFVILVSVTTSKADGWRSYEKQIVLTINSQEQADLLFNLKINYDIIAENSIRAYVVPKELTQIELMGLSYEVEIEDLNKQDQGYLLADVAYHSYQEIIDLADSLELNFPEICKKYVFGTSMGGRQLAALKISDNVEIDEDEAEVMFDGGIHGDEICGPENIIRFARDICIAYDTEPEITYLIDNRETWLYLMVNPDGREAVPRTRYNNNGVDLNRDWGYMWDAWGGSTGAWSQVESRALRNCMYGNQFVVHTTYHGGTEYISLPWSYRSSQPLDWNHIDHLGGVYSAVSGYPNLEYGQGNSGMYAINGSTKDSNYGIMGSISWSMEISYEKQPPVSQLMMYYDRNYPSMLAMLEYAGYGLEGNVTDANTGDPIQAVVFINDFLPTFTDPVVGDYHKYVLPGIYSITIVANGYETQTINDILVTENTSTSTDFELLPEVGQYVYRFTSSQIPENNEADEGLTPAVIGAPDNISYSLGKSGWCVLDMQYPVVDGPNYDIIVYEGDETPEIYTCYAGESMDGPWYSLGAGVGTSEFDIINSGLSEVQFIKILDDGDGAANAPNAGFDLDAIETLESDSGIYIAMYNYTIIDTSGNSNGRIDPGETVDLIVTLKNNGDIPAENTIGVLNTSSEYITIENNTVNYGTLNQGQSVAGTFTVTANASTPQGEPAIFNLAIEAAGGTYNNSFLLSFTIGLIVEDWETGNLEKFNWETGGNTDWDISDQNVYEGNYCVKSGSISDQQSSWISISFDVLANGEIGFFKQVSSEETYDFLNFYIDGNLMDHWSGEVLWSESNYPVTSGNHTFKWEYAKDNTVSNGSDCAWVDFITLPSGAFNTIYAGFIADNTEVCEEDSVHFINTSVGNITAWQWIFEGGFPNSSTLLNPTIAYPDEGIFDVILTAYQGIETSVVMLEDYITVMPQAEIPTTPEGPVSVASYPGEVSSYTSTGSGDAESFLWSLVPDNAGELTQNGLECTVDWTDFWTGEASIKVKSTNDCGDSEYSDSLQILCYITNTSSNSTNEIYIVPNPNNGIFSIHFNDPLSVKNSNLRIVNGLGNIVYQDPRSFIKNGILQLNLSYLEPGIYFLVLVSDNIVIKEKILIK